MKKNVLVLAAVLVSVVFPLSSTRGTTMISMSMEQLTQVASAIVQAQVTSRVSAWNAAHTQIITTTTLQVSQTYKGSVPSPLVIEQLGGTVGNMTVTVPSDVALQPQGEYVLFLETSDGTHYQILGMSQGAFPVYQDAATHQARVVLPVNQTQVQSLVAGGGNPIGTVPLVGFHKYVKALVPTSLQIPHGLSLTVSIAYTEARGAGRLHVYGRTTQQLFPNKNMIIPAGTEVEGDAVLSGGSWTIHWQEVNVRGLHSEISAVTNEAEGSLTGKNEILRVR